jgi:hypothetical protein
LLATVLGALRLRAGLRVATAFTSGLLTLLFGAAALRGGLLLRPSILTAFAALLRALLARTLSPLATLALGP